MSTNINLLRGKLKERGVTSRNLRRKSAWIQALCPANLHLMV